MLYLYNFKFQKVVCISLFFLAIQLLIVGNAKSDSKYIDDLPVPFSQIVWDHPDISHWPITSDMQSVYIQGDELFIRNSKECVWPAFPGTVSANASPWAIHLSRDGRWHANNWDHMRQCQHWRPTHAVGSGFDGWTPKAGEVVYFFVSGQARPNYPGNVQERTNVVKYIWHGSPGFAISAPPSCSGPPVIKSFGSSAATINKGTPVTLSWIIDKAESIKIITDTGKNINVVSKDPTADSITLSLEKTTTFTISADNCDDGALPSFQVTVRVVDELPWLAPLLLSAPVVTTEPACNIQDVSADLQGTVKTFGRDAVVAFEYGTEEDPYGQKIAGTPTKVNNTQFEEITATVKRLDPGTTYYFRLKATSGSRVFYGKGVTFRTQSDSRID